MPSNVRRTRTSRTGARLGRPPSPESGNWEKFYTLLKPDVGAYIRARHVETGTSMAKIISELVSEGIAIRLDREQTAEAMLHQREDTGPERDL
jgi:hypothetical protein